MKRHTDSEILDFLERHDLTKNDVGYFTVLTQQVNKNQCKTIREFCEKAISLEEMLIANSITPNEWHNLPAVIQHTIFEIWDRYTRPLNEAEKLTIDEELEEITKNGSF